MFGRIGGFLSPFIIQIPATWIIYLVNLLLMKFCVIYLQIFGVFGIVSGAVVFFLPETNGKPTLQTLEEALEFYKNPSGVKKYEDTVSKSSSKRSSVQPEIIDEDATVADFQNLQKFQ